MRKEEGVRKHLWCHVLGDVFIFLKQRAPYDVPSGLVGSDMCIRDRELIMVGVEVLST